MEPIFETNKGRTDNITQGCFCTRLLKSFLLEFDFLRKISFWGLFETKIKGEGKVTSFIPPSFLSCFSPSRHFDCCTHPIIVIIII